MSASVLALQIDPVAGLKPRTDTSLLLALEAQARGYRVFCYQPNGLHWAQGRVAAHGSWFTFHADPAHYFTEGKRATLFLDEARVVLMRQDPPFDMHYITATYLLEQIGGNTLVSNHPATVRNNPEKLYPLRFAEFMPPTLISANVDDIAAFRREQGAIIIKPLYGHGGSAVFHIGENDVNFHALLELFFTQSPLPLMVQRFLPEVRTQEVRIILVDGAFGGMMGKIPVAHEIRSNLRFGSEPVKAELTPRQRQICDALQPVLHREGIHLAGIDVIGDYLTEINITSPTGLPAINRLYGLKLEARVWDALEARL